MRDPGLIEYAKMIVPYGIAGFMGAAAVYSLIKADFQNAALEGATSAVFFSIGRHVDKKYFNK